MQQSAMVSADYGTAGSLQSRLASLMQENTFLRAVMENFPGGIMVYDSDLRLVLCNQRQRELLEYPPYLFEFGMPTLEQIFRFNANRGEYGPGDIEQHVRFRLERAAKCEPHVFQRVRPNGVTVEVRGVPMPGGGLLTTYLEVDDRNKNDPQKSPPVPVTPAREMHNWETFQAKVDEVLADRVGTHIYGLHYIDVDGYQALKAKMGGEAARALANAFGQRIFRSTRATDIIGHLGEDDFVVLQSGVNRPSDVIRLQTTLADLTRQPITVGTTEHYIRASVGVALCPRDGTTAESLRLKAVDSLRRARGE